MKKNTPVILLLFFLLLLAAVPALAVEYTGRVVGVHDGDTLTLLTPEEQQVQVRLGESTRPNPASPTGPGPSRPSAIWLMGRRPAWWCRILTATAVP